jgi:hypothetical protein
MYVYAPAVASPAPTRYNIEGSGTGVGGDGGLGGFFPRAKAVFAPRREKNENKMKRIIINIGLHLDFI